MIKRLAFFGLLSISLTSLAQDFLPGHLSKITGAQMYCSQKGGMYAINFSTKRVWQSDPGASDGLELSQVQIKPFRCPNCFDIEGYLLPGLRVSIKMRGKNLDTATADVQISSGNDTETFNGLECSKFNTK